jgi:hypothetical protein
MTFAEYKLTRDNSNLEHSADPQEIDDLETYLKDRIPPLGDKVGGL